MRATTGAKEGLILVSGLCALCLLGGCAVGSVQGRGGYIGASGLASALDAKVESTGHAIERSRGAGASVALGYAFGARLSVEAELRELGAARLEPAGEIRYRSLAASVVVRSPPWLGSLTASARAGAGSMSYAGDGVELDVDERTQALVGVGLDYRFAHGFGMRAEIGSHGSVARYVQAGVVYRFGARGTRAPRAIATREPVPRAERDRDRIAREEAEALPSEMPSQAPERAIASSVAPRQAGRGARTGGRAIPEERAFVLQSLPVREVRFEPGSSVLGGAARAVLDGVASEVALGGATRLLIEGHGGSAGGRGDAIAVSGARALAVVRYLIARGVPESTMSVRAFGAARGGGERVAIRAIALDGARTRR